MPFLKTAAILFLSLPAAGYPGGDEESGQWARALYDGQLGGAPLVLPHLPAPEAMPASGPAGAVLGGATEAVSPASGPGAGPSATDDGRAAPAWPTVPLDPDAKKETPPATRIPIEDSDWEETRGMGGAVEDRNPTAAEKLAFWEKLRDRDYWDESLEKLCREARLPAAHAFRIDGVGSVQPAFERRLRRFPAGGLAIVDSARLRLNLGWSQSIADLGAGLPASVSLGASLEGAAAVIRPLKEKRSCRELDSLLDLREIKVVLPMTAKRFQKMAVGEIWKIPARFTAYLGASAGTTASGVPVSVSLGYSREGGVSVTLRRLSERELRFRLRLDHAQVLSANGSVAGFLKGEDFLRYQGEGRDILEDNLGGLIGGTAFKPLDRALLGPLKRLLNFQLSLVTQWTSGDHILVEFVLDPENEEQMKALEELLIGGKLQVLPTLWKGIKTLGETFSGIEAARRTAHDLAKAYSAALGRDPFFSATDAYRRWSLPFRLRIPVLGDFSFSYEKERDRVALSERDGGAFHIYKARSDRNAALLDIPFLGHFVKHNTRRSVLTFSYTDAEGYTTVPEAVYLQQAGFVRQSEAQVRAMLEGANDILRYAGAAGKAPDGRFLLPSAKVLPPSPLGTERFFKRGVTAFSLSFKPEAVADLRRASSADVLRAYARALDYDYNVQRAMLWALDHGKVHEDGSVAYDAWELNRSFPAGTPDGMSRELSKHFYWARRLAENLAELKTGDPDAAGKVRDLMAGASGTPLPYEYTLKVLVQLIDPKHLSAEFLISAKEEGGAKANFEARYVLNQDPVQSSHAGQMGELLARFAPPLELGD